MLDFLRRVPNGFLLELLHIYGHYVVELTVVGDAVVGTILHLLSLVFSPGGVAELI